MDGRLWLFTTASLGHGLGSGMMMTLGSDLSPKKERSACLGAWRFFGDAGNSGGSLILGWVADALALPVAALAIAVPGFWQGLCLLSWCRRRLKSAYQWPPPISREQDEFLIDHLKSH